MDENAMSFNETQFKRSGFAEAFTPDVIAQMKNGVPNIESVFKKDYEGDLAVAKLHLKKSSTSDFYFLNKFDLQLRKQDQSEEINQVFFVNSKIKKDLEEGAQKAKQEVRWTLKKAFNFLAGRSVYHENDQSWERINYKKLLANGNHASQRYDRNYGFDLEKVLSQYSIEELANEKYKQSLIESLQRGNFQKVTFVDKDGKEEKLYVLPNLRSGSLNVYNLNRESIKLENLKEKQFINKDFAENLSVRLNANQQKQNQKQETPVQSTRESQKVDKPKHAKRQRHKVK